MSASPIIADGPSVLLTVTPEHRSLAIRQVTIQLFTTWVTVIALLVADLNKPVLPRETVYMWFGVFIASWLLRMVMYYPLYRLAPAELVKRKVLRGFPLLTALIGNAFWIWTIPLFSGPGMQMQQLIMCAGFLCISISTTSMWPVTPITSLAYYFLLWGTFSYNLWVRDPDIWPAVLALNALVIGVLWVNVFVSTIQVQSQIRRAVELDAALDSAKTANDKLGALKDQAVSQLAQRSKYFQQATHDLRQRLHALRLWVSSAMELSSADGPARYPLNQVADQVGDLEGYFTKILDFAKLEAQSPVQSSLFKVQTIFQSLELHFEHLVMTSKIDLRISPTRAMVFTDQALLQRVMENLVENAVVHGRGVILVTARKAQGALCLDVYDNGPGIPKEQLRRIFDPYYQYEPNTNQRRKGAGLGLAIVKEISTQLGAMVEVRSVVGRGTRFRVAIPISLR